MFNKKGDKQTALNYMEKAFSLDTQDERIFMELDQLYKRLQYKHDERLRKFEENINIVSLRDDLVLEYATLLNQTGQYEKAIEEIDGHQFHVWEGGEGKVSGQYQLARVELAKKLMAQDNYDRAIELLTQCLTFPHNLGEGKLFGAQDNDFYYLLGVAYQQKGDSDKAKECWQKGTEGPTEPAPALYYNDAKPDKIYYAAKCYIKLGQTDKARGLFYKLINFGKNHIFDEVRMDYFAVSLPDLLVWDDSLQVKNTIHCKYMLALGYMGLGNVDNGKRYLDEASQLDCNHLGIQELRTFIEYQL
jgi:tetratricopeptide (TPR) repeat protein